MNSNTDTPANGTPAATAPPLPTPPGISTSWPHGRTPAGKLGLAGFRNQKTGEKLVTALWMAHRAARHLRRVLKRHKPKHCPRLNLPCCAACGRADAAVCHACDLIEVLTGLIGRKATVRLGEAADRAAQVLPYFDLHRRLQQLDTFFDLVFRRDDAEEETATVTPVTVDPPDGKIVDANGDGHK
jgi:hypothetical protein